MADFLLTVGLNIDASYEQLQKDIQSVIKNIDKNPPAIKIKFDETALNKMREQIKELNNGIKNMGAVNPTGGGKGVSQFTKAKSAITDYYQELQNLQKLETDIVKQGDTWTSKSGKWNEFAKRLNTVQSAYDGVKKSMSGLSGDQQIALTNAETKYASALERTKNLSEERVHQIYAQGTAIGAANTAVTRGETLLKNYSAAATSANSAVSGAYIAVQNQVEAVKAARSAYDGSAESLKNLQDATAVLNSTTKTSTQIIKENNSAHQTLGTHVLGLAKKFAQWFGITRVIMAIVRTIKKMVSATIEIDDAMAQLKIVTGATDAEMEKFLTSSIKLAKELGKSVTDIASSIETFSRLGYNLTDASELAEYANILSNVASVDTDTATTGLTSIIKGYSMDVSEAEHVADVLIKVGQEYAISAEELMAAFQRGGAALYASGTDFEKSAALFAATNASLQNAETVGTMWKTVSARIRGATTELEELGEESEGLSDGLSKYREEIISLSGVDIMKDENTYKDMYDIFVELAQVWDSLKSDEARSRIAEILGGTRQFSGIMSTITNIKDAIGAYEGALDSAGTTTQANAIYMETATAHINQFKAVFQEMSAEILNSGFIIGLVDAGSGVLEFVTSIAQLANSLGGLPTVLLGVASAVSICNAAWTAHAVVLIKNFVITTLTGLFNTLKNAVISIVYAIPSAISAWKSYAAGVVSANTTMQASIPVIGLVLAAISALIGGVALANQEQDELAEKTKERAKAWRNEQDSMDDTIKKYRELQKSIESQTLTRSELQSVNEQLSSLQNDLIDKYGAEAEKIDLVNGKYDEEIAKLRELIGLKAVESEADLLDTKDDAEDTLRDKGAYISIDAGTVQMPDEYDAIKSAVSKVGLSHYLDDDDGTLGFDFFLTPDMDTSEVIQVYNDMVKLRDMLAQSYRDEIAEGGSLEDFYNNLTKKVNDMKTAVSEYQNALDNYNMNLAVGIFNNAMNTDGTKKADEYGLVNGSLIKTQEEFDTYLKSIRESETMPDGLKEALVNIANTAFPDFAYSATNAGKAVAGAVTQIGTATEKLKNASDGISSLAKAYQELADEDTGYISTDTLASIHEAVGDSIDNWSDYQDKLLSAKLGSEEFNNVLRDLTYAILEQQFSQKGLANATEEEVAAVLRENGVLNANKIASEAVTIAKTKQRIQTQLTADASSSAIAALLSESDSCGIAENAYIGLIAQEIIFNQNGLDVSQKLAALQALAQQAGITSAALASILNSPIGKDSATQKAWAEKHGFTVSTKKNADGSIKYTTHTDADGTKRKVEDWIWTKDGVTYENANEAALSLAGSYFSEIPTVSTPSIPNYSGAAKSSGSKKETEEQFDWIERKLKAIQRVVSNIGKTVSATYKTWTTRGTALKDQMAAINSEIATQQNAMNAYMAAANSIGLDSYYVNLIKNGGFNISTITDEDLIDQINEYQDLYDKAIECQDAIIDLQAEMASLAKQSFDNISKEYSDKLALMEHMTNTFNTGIEKIEAQGYLASTKYYSAMRDVENENIKVQKQELQQLVTAMSAVMNAGLIEKGSEDWYAMQQEINAVKEAIQQSELAVIEFGNSIREVEWGHFDYLQEQISNVTAEADFLIKLMENSDLYTDNGQLTDTGKATMGLHGQNYNVYMHQADEYAKEILAINELLANDPNNTTLLERKEELLELQRESILSAEDEKQAIIDMVEEGINLELEALSELIDKYKESLDSAKDLYDYQKKIKEQTSEIATLQKQLSAYRNDMSEENRAVVQKIEVNLAKAMETLEETQYERYISDTTKLLDNLYLEYETMLNSRLDDAEVLMNDMITEINQSATDIATALNTEATEAGYTLSESMKSIWMPEGQAYTVITSYGEKFNTALTTVNSTLTTISTNVGKMIKESDKEADKTVDGATPTTEADPSVKPAVVQQVKPPTVQPTQTTAKAITVGGKINAGSARIYSTSSGGGGGTQYYKNDPIYTVLGEKNGYLKVRYHKLSSGVTGWFKKSDVKAYKTGGLVDYTGLAWVDGEKDKPESFLDSEDTANVMSLRDVLRDIADGHISLDSIFAGGKLDISETLGHANVPDGIQGTTFGDVHYEINIPIDHVEDYNDFMNKMRNDDKFERFIQSMTVDRLVGRSKLEKSKFKW